MRMIMFAGALIAIVFIIGLGIYASRPAKPKKLTSTEKLELNDLRALKDNLQEMAADQIDQPFASIVIDEIKIHNQKTRQRELH